MSQESLEMFLGRLITDDHFRRLASKSFLNVSLEYGFKLTQDEQKLLREIDFNKFTSLAKNLDGRIKRSCGLPEGKT